MSARTTTLGDAVSELYTSEFVAGIKPMAVDLSVRANMMLVAQLSLLETLSYSPLGFTARQMVKRSIAELTAYLYGEDGADQ